MLKRSKKSQAPAQSEAKVFSTSDFKDEILHEAKILGIPDAVAKTITDRTTGQIEKWVKKRAAITAEDLNQQVAKELGKYNADLAYVYQNRGKII